MSELGTYIIYAYAPDDNDDPQHGFQALRVNNANIKLTDQIVHSKIREMELRNPSGQSVGAHKTPLFVGSFNFRVIENSFCYEDAIASAYAAGLRYESKDVCRAHYVEQYLHKKVLKPANEDKMCHLAEMMRRGLTNK